MKNQNHIKEAIFYFIIIATILFIFFGAVSCNPIKKVLKNPVKKDQMAAEIIKLGYCINDTIIFELHDTISTTDTIDVPVIITDSLFRNDTLFFWETKYLDIVTTKVITKQLDRVVIDSAKIKLLEKELAELKIKFADVDQRRKNWRTQFGAAFSALMFAIISIVVLIKYHARQNNFTKN
jgi:hypothetical protein